MKTVVAFFDPLLDMELKRTLLRRRDLRLATVRTVGDAMFRMHGGAALCMVTARGIDAEARSTIDAIRSEKRFDNIPLVLVLPAPVKPQERQKAAQLGYAEVLEIPSQPGGIAMVTARLLGLPLREAERFLVRLQVFEENSRAPEYLGNTVDLSEGGMLVRSQREIAVGTELEVRFSLPNVQDELVLKARIVRVDAVMFAPQRALALQFERTAARTSNILRDHLEQLVTKNPFSWEHTSESGREVVTFFGVPRKPADLASLNAMQGEVTFRLKNFFPLSSDAIHLWLVFVRGLKKVTRIKLFDCPPAFMQYACRTRNLLQRSEVASFLAPYSCPECHLEELKTVDVTYDLDGGKKLQMPGFACPSCTAKMNFDALEEQFLAVFETPA